MPQPSHPVVLYHGSHEVLTKIRGGGLFGGVFAAIDEGDALSHGEQLHKIVIDEEDIATTVDFNYYCEPTTIDSVFAVYGPDRLEQLWAAVVDEDESVIDDLIGVLGSDYAETSWDAQRIRGEVAKACGYLAVEMTDEHGTTYLVLPGVSIHYLGSWE